VLNRQVAAGFYRSTVTLPRDLLNERRYEHSAWGSIYALDSVRVLQS